MSQNALAKLFGSLSEAEVKSMLDTLQAQNFGTVATKLEAAVKESEKDIAMARKATKAEADKAAKAEREKQDAAALENVKGAIAGIGRDYRGTFDLQVTFGTEGAVTVKATLTGDSIISIGDAVAAKVKAALGATVVKDGLTVVITADGAAVKGKANSPTGKRNKSTDGGETGVPYVGSGDRRVSVDGKVYAQATDACAACGVEPGKQSAWVALFADGDALKAHNVQICGTFTEKLSTMIQKQVSAGNLETVETLEM